MLNRILALTIAIVLLAIGPANAQAPDTLWTRLYGSPGSDYGACVVQTTDGGFALTGSTMPYGPDSSADVYLVKTDRNGNLLWSKNHGDNGHFWDCGRHIQQTIDGGYIITGETESLGQGEWEHPDILMLKVDSAGNQQWYRTFGDGGEDSDIGYWVEQTADRGYILTGEVNNITDLVLIKTDSLGNAQWSRLFGTGYSEFAGGHCVRPTPDGGYIVGGLSDYISGPWFGAYLLKVDSLGIEQWSRHYPVSDASWINSVHLTSDGYIMTGHRGEGNSFDIFLKKVSTDGAEQWTRYFAPGPWDFGNSVEPTSDGGFILAGSSDARVHGYSDAYIVKTNSDGDTEWELFLGGDYADFARCILQTSDGGYVCCGVTSDGVNADAWLIRIAAEGTPIDVPDNLTPFTFKLDQPYPNPFNASTTISYSLPSPGPVTLDIYDYLGRRIIRLSEGNRPAGRHTVTWDASNVPSGIYFTHLQSGERSEIVKMTLLK